MASGCTIYIIVGIFGYAHAGDYTCDNILLNFGPHDKFIGVARAALSISMLCTYPLIVLPCRSAFSALFALCQGQKTVSEVATSPSTSPRTSPRNLPQKGEIEENLLAADALHDEVALNVGSDSKSDPANLRGGNLVYVYRENESKQLVQIDAYKPKDLTNTLASKDSSIIAHSLWTVGIIGSSLTIGLFLKAVMVVWSVMGATVCFMVAFVLPITYYLKLSPQRSGSRSRIKRAVAKVILGIVICAIFGCTIMTVVKVVESNPACPKW